MGPLVLRLGPYGSCGSGAADAGYRKNAFHRYYIDGAGGTLAWAPACWKYNAYPRDLSSVSIIFDSSESYYTGTSYTPSNQFDLYAVATHEVGHALGFGQNPSNHLSHVCSSAFYAATMCPYINQGNYYPRTLEAHDIHTFQAVY